MFDEDHKVSELMLCIINDGNGDQCGRSYEQRCEAASSHGLFEFRYMARECRRRVHPDWRDYSAACTRAGDLLFAYYEEHVKGMVTP